MEYKGHPVLEPEPHPNSNENAKRMQERMREFHERRGHGEIRVTFPSRTASCSLGHALESDSGSADRVLDSDGATADGVSRTASTGLPNGVWTIEGPRGHRTFRVSTIQKGESDFKDRHVGKRILELLTGPDNTANYRGLAWIVDANTRSDHSSVGKLWKLGLENVVLVNTFCKLVEREEPVAGYTVHFAKHCLKCNRLLTTPESIVRGIGPVCAGGGWDA